MPAEAILITAQNKIQRVAEQCRRSHEGSVSDELEVENMMKPFSDENRRKTALILEIT